MAFDSMTMARARLALRMATQQHLFDPNVRIVSLGLPEKDGEVVEDELAIRYHVQEKYTPFELEAALASGQTQSDLAQPITVGRFRIQADVVQGKYAPHLWQRPTPWWRPPASNPRMARADPMRGGISISDEFHNAFATLGGKVIDRATGAEMMLSNWHVLVAEWTARPGQRIYQPGRLDGGTRADSVARLRRDAMGVNLDAAVAALDGSRRLINDQLGLGPLTGVASAQLGMEVAKSGRRTGITHGRVTDVEGTARIRYGTIDRIIRRVFTIEPRRSFEEVSDSGDSGALWIDPATMQAVGLHFAGSNMPERALAMDLLTVLDALDVDLATDRPLPAARQFTRTSSISSAPAAAQLASRESAELVTR